MICTVWMGIILDFGHPIVTAIHPASNGEELCNVFAICSAKEPAWCIMINCVMQITKAFMYSFKFLVLGPVSAWL